ncbi:MAG: lipopolysaccharide kinase InaA family protein [Acidobacteriota bacterium]
MIEAPRGFVSIPLCEGGQLLLDQSLSATTLAHALREPWRHTHPRPISLGTGRGPRGLLALPDAPAVMVKQCLRGGWLAPLNRQRYFGLSRFGRELVASRAAREAGLPVGETVAVTFVPSRPGWRVWSASRWIADAEDLAHLWLQAPDAATRAELWAAALTLLDAIAARGLEHPDLNLGNVLMRRDSQRGWSAILIDFDRARWSGKPVSSSARAGALARLERSRDKLERRAALSVGGSTVR